MRNNFIPHHCIPSPRTLGHEILPQIKQQYLFLLSSKLPDLPVGTHLGFSFMLSGATGRAAGPHLMAGLYSHVAYAMQSHFAQALRVALEDESWLSSDLGPAVWPCGPW